MENKNDVILFSLIFLIIGIVLGMVIKNLQSHHVMPDGTIMANDGSDMHSMMMDMTARMKGKTDDELDRVFLEDMIVHHQGAIDMAKLLAAETKRTELQKMAQDIITVQTKEIQMMQQWQKAWFGN